MKGLERTMFVAILLLIVGVLIGKDETARA
jgi:hypothetical protein